MALIVSLVKPTVTSMRIFFISGILRSIYSVGLGPTLWLMGAIQVDDMNELMMDTIEVTTCSEIGNPVSLLNNDTVGKIVTVPLQDETPEHIERIVKEIKEHGEKFESKNSLSTIIATTN